MKKLEKNFWIDPEPSRFLKSLVTLGAKIIIFQKILIIILKTVKLKGF